MIQTCSIPEVAAETDVVQRRLHDGALDPQIRWKPCPPSFAAPELTDGTQRGRLTRASCQTGSRVSRTRPSAPNTR